MAVLRPSSVIQGVTLVRLDSFADPRGSFREAFRKEWFPERPWSEVQANVSTSRQGVLRGLHFHLRQVDYWFPVSGRIRVGLFDLRRGSPTRGAREVLELHSGEPAGLLVPVGVAHGYCALTDAALAYLVDTYYDGTDEHGVAWNDPTIAMPWGVEDPVISVRDAANPRLDEIPQDRLPD